MGCFLVKSQPGRVQASSGISLIVTGPIGSRIFGQDCKHFHRGAGSCRSIERLPACSSIYTGLCSLRCSLLDEVTTLSKYLASCMVLAPQVCMVVSVASRALKSVPRTAVTALRHLYRFGTLLSSAHRACLSVTLVFFLGWAARKCIP